MSRRPHSDPQEHVHGDRGRNESWARPPASGEPPWGAHPEDEVLWDQARPPASGEPRPEARDLVEEILLMTDERDDSVPLTDWLPDEWVDRATALINEPRTEARATPPLLPEHLRGDGPCDDCGTLDNIGWFTDNVLWNEVTGEHVIHEQPRSGILCIPCFVKRTDAVGLHPTGWRLIAEWPWRARLTSPPTRIRGAPDR